MGFFDIFRKKYRERVKNVEPFNPLKHDIECPYCFEKFKHSEVHFRSTTLKGSVPSVDDLQNRDWENSDEMNEAMEEAALARKFTLRKDDPQLKRFWKRRFDIEPSTVDRQWNHPIITPDDEDMMWNQNKNDGLQYDNIGFLTGIKDYYGTLATTRLCPHCHNVISPIYGKYEVIYIAVVGMTGSGKTVYLNQLLDTLPKSFANAGLVANKSFNLMTETQKIRKNKFLPEASTEGRMYPPMSINVMNSYGVEKTLVFYDIAGENCTEAYKLSKFGPYLKQAEAVLLLMDPKEFRDGRGERASAVIEALSVFYDTNNTRKPWAAVVFSKSDVWKQYIDSPIYSWIREDSVIFQDVPSMVYQSEDRRGFDLTSFNKLKGVLLKWRKEYLDTSEVLKNTLNGAKFQGYDYFAVSALGGKVQPEYNIGTGENAEFINITDEAAEKIEMIVRLSDLNKLDEDEIGLYQGQYAVKLTDSEEDDDLMSFQEIWEKQITPRYLLLNAPSPCRVAEPLLWILYKMDIVKGIESNM